MRKLSLTALALAFASGCSSNSDGGTPTADAGAPDAVADTAIDPSMVKDEGVMIDFGTSKPLEGVTVSEAGVSTVTGTDGKFSLVVPKGVAQTLSFGKDGYIRENYPEGILSVNVDRGRIKIVPQDTYDLVTGSFPGFEPSHGLLYIEVETESTCATATGSTVAFANPAVEQVRYVKGGIPSAAQASINQAELPVVALFYNVPTDTQLDVVFHDTPCTQAPFPYVEASTGITYTGSVQVHDTASTIARYFLK